LAVRWEFYALLVSVILAVLAVLQHEWLLAVVPAVAFVVLTPVTIRRWQRL
jgi:hypothetical protein